MGQFTAKGCFFLRDTDIKMEHRWYVEVDVGKTGVWSGGGVEFSQREKKKKKENKMWDQANQDVSTNMFVISAGRQECLDCSSGL